jgi:hypothetical protein
MFETHPLGSLLQYRVHGPRALKQDLPEVVDLGSAARTVQDPYSQPPLELRNAIGERRLRQAPCRGSAIERPMIGDCQEIREVSGIDFDARTPCGPEVRL